MLVLISFWFFKIKVVITWIGIAKVCSEILTKKTLSVVSVTGISIRTQLPFPNSEITLTLPLSCEIFVLTTSSPIPRPEILVIESPVVNPGQNIMFIIDSSVIESISSCVKNPLETALSLIFCRLKPWPSSATSIITLLSSCFADKSILPTGFLPFAILSSLVSIPWSMAFLKMWINGVLISSMIFLSAQVSLPSISKSMSLPFSLAISRTILVNELNTVEIGNTRMFLTIDSISSIIKRIFISSSFEVLYKEFKS